jgi:hypothetical protein
MSRRLMARRVGEVLVSSKMLPSSLTDGGVLLGSGTDAITAMSVLADGAIIVGDGSGDPVALSAFSSSTGTLNVAKGGTGASTLTDGGILLGSGTNAVTAMSVLADGAIVVGDGSTDPVALSAFSSSTGTLNVSSGGTGASSLTDGGVLLGSGTGGVTAMSVLADSEIIVGDGSGDPVAESGATLRTSIGVGTGDTVQFALLKVGSGSASAPTITDSGDPDTGLFFDTNKVVVATGGEEASRFATGSGAFGYKLTNAGGTDPNGIHIDFSAADRDNNTEVFLRCEDSSAIRAIIYADGDLQNHDNSYGAISDRKLKQDITPANSQWEDIKALSEIAVNFRFKSDVIANPDAGALLGLVAQDVEPISPGLVIDHPDMEEVIDESGQPVQRPTGTITKSIQYSVLYMKAVKALGEALERVEALELRVTALEG